MKEKSRSRQDSYSISVSRESCVTAEFKKRVARKKAFIGLSALTLLAVSLGSLATGAIPIRFFEILSILIRHDTAGLGRILWDIRLPRLVGAILVGAGLSLSGTVMQSILRNPLASPYTLGLSNAAAFGASFAIVFLHAGSNATASVVINNPYIVACSAFAFSILATITILLLASRNRVSAESMVLSGIAIGALFSAGLTLMQYLADSVQLANIVTWSFGDLGRSNWNIILLLSVSLVVPGVFFLANLTNFNALSAGEETARSLGVKTGRLRVLSMFAASFVSALIVSMFGIIAFIGLLGPHISRRLIGSDHRYLMISAPLVGAILLVIADIVSRTMLAPMILPVGILTSMLGAPLFIYLLLRGKKQWRS